ncbi:putative indole-diterpene biosynthesis protein [Rosellinia necatrix]|uniref:Putative indole-diterpene biosynthesis protein n=1 Tax=Rosellinia necatrix TaxID=77044 RepID=A0A1W2TCR8_ROSNE|nr:putative indole-diterpene biosynthesis protein [Rosellinia necatrix]
MGSNTRANPLSGLQRLSPAVYLLHPRDSPQSPEDSAAGRPADPRLVLLLGWMDARDGHLVQYVRKYQELYPSSPILLVKSRLAALVWPSIGSRDSAPAVDLIRTILKEAGVHDSTAPPRLLIHALSGGGSCSLYHLYNHFSSHQGSRDAGGQAEGVSEPTSLPNHVTLFDSIPGIWSYQFNVNVLTASSKPGWGRLLVLPVAHLVALTCWVLIRVFGVPDNQATWSTAHNDPARNREVRRTYLYSHDDKICPSTSVEKHAAEAISKGFDVKLELFNGSGHVAHMRSDSNRYWRIVGETWQGASRL